MENVTSADQLAARIEQTQSRLAATTQELRHELSPGVVAGKVRQNVSDRIKALLLDDSGMPKVPVLVAGVSAAVAVVGCIIAKATK